MTLHISRKKAHRGTIGLRRNAFGKENYFMYHLRCCTVVAIRHVMAWRMTLSATLWSLRLRPLPSCVK